MPVTASNQAQTQQGEARTRDGTRLVYTLRQATPDAPRIALTHSLAMDRSFWNPVADRLAVSASVLTYDCRGHGQSDKPAGPYTVELFADDLADLLDHIGWRSPAVAGASMGGCVSLAFAIRHAKRTTGLGLIDTTACYEAMPAWLDRAEKAKQGGLAGLIGFQTTRWFGDAFRAAHPQVVQDCVDTFVKNDVPAYAETCRMLGACDLRAGLSKIAVPTAVVVGEEDYATPVKMAETLHAGIAGSTLTVLKGGRHLTPLEMPEKIAAELASIMRAEAAA
jgi:3-oxoadipate enol-lactonase